MQPLVAVPAIILLLYRAWSRQSLTPAGLVTAGITASIHALHPWSVFFAFLGAFFLAGTAVTKVGNPRNLWGSGNPSGSLPSTKRKLAFDKASNGEATRKDHKLISYLQVNHAYKSTLTTSAADPSSSSSTDDSTNTTRVPPKPESRTSTQVLCNSLPATLAIAVHTLYLNIPTSPPTSLTTTWAPPCLAQLSALHVQTTTFPYDSLLSAFTNLAPLLPYAILAHYASASADTFSSELGILSPHPPFLITDLPGLLKLQPRRVPRGTNGGVTAAGLLAGFGGAALIGVVGVLLLPFCAGWGVLEMVGLGLGTAVVGTLGSVVDSVLGAVFQASVVDKESGKVVEGAGGVKVVVETGKGKGKTERLVVVGWDLLSNNGVNLLMCTTMSLVGMGVAWNVACLYE